MRTFSKKHNLRRTRRAGNTVGSTAHVVHNIMDDAIPDSVAHKLPQGVLAGSDCAAIEAKAKKCFADAQAQADKLKADADEAQKKADAAKLVQQTAKTAAVTAKQVAGPKLRKLSPAEKQACTRQVKQGMYKNQAACELLKAKTGKKGGKRHRRRGTKKGMRRKTARLAYSKKHGRGGRRTRR